MSDIAEFTKQGLESAASLMMSRDFGWYGDDPETVGVTRCLAFSQSRNAGAIERTNWSFILDALREVDPEGVNWRVESFGHWALGSVDQVLFTVYDAEGEYTPAWVGAFHLKESLDDYPVLDEEELNRVEYDELCDYLTAEVPIVWGRFSGEIPEGLIERVLDIVYGSGDYCRAEDIPFGVLEQAVEDAYAKGLLEDIMAVSDGQRALL